MRESDAVAEIQIVHQHLLKAREELGFHDAYGDTRFAGEMAYVYQARIKTAGLPWSRFEETEPLEQEGKQDLVEATGASQSEATASPKKEHLIIDCSHFTNTLLTLKTACGLYLGGSTSLLP